MVNIQSCFSVVALLSSLATILCLSSGPECFLQVCLSRMNVKLQEIDITDAEGDGRISNS